MKKINAKIYYDEDFPGKFFIRHDNGRVEVANVVTPKRTAQRGGYAFFFRTMAALKHHRERTTAPFCKVEFKISGNN